MLRLPRHRRGFTLDKKLQPRPEIDDAHWREIAEQTNREVAVIARIDGFLRKHEMLVRITYRGEKCPPWADSHRWQKCSRVHGDQFHVEIKRGGKTVTFEYWNSREDMADDRRPEREDVMTRIASYSLPTTGEGIRRVYSWFTEGEMGEIMAW